jgi:hypothetical protein
LLQTVQWRDFTGWLSFGQAATGGGKPFKKRYESELAALAIAQTDLKRIAINAVI